MRRHAVENAVIKDETCGVTGSAVEDIGHHRLF